jgi:hypothetical protein
VKLTPLRIVIAAWAVFLVYSFPGYVDIPGGDILADARAEQFSDWHSPVMAKVWYVLGHVISGPPGMLVLQSGLLVFGAYHLLRRVCPERTAALLAGGLLVFPPVMAVEAVTCPQSLFAGLALAGMALVTSACRLRKIGGLVMFLVAAGLHAGSAVAVVPLVLFGFRWREGMPRVRRFALAAGACAAIVLGAFGLERAIIQERSYRSEVALARYDLAGILAKTRTPNRRVEAILRFTGDHPAERAALMDARDQLIREHKGAYVKHRLAHLRAMLRSTSKLNVEFTAIDLHAGVLAHRGRHSWVQRALIAPVRVLSRTPLFWPILYMLIAITGIVVAAMSKQLAPIVWFASAIGYEIAAAFPTVSTDRVHSHWLVTSTLVGVALLGILLRHRGDRPERALEVDADRPAVPVE